MGQPAKTVGRFPTSGAGGQKGRYKDDCIRPKVGFLIRQSTRGTEMAPPRSEVGHQGSGGNVGRGDYTSSETECFTTNRQAAAFRQNT